MSWSWTCKGPLVSFSKLRVRRVLEYLEKDAKFLEEQGVMDYSLLLVGHTSTADLPCKSQPLILRRLGRRACKKGGRQCLPWAATTCE